MISLFFSYSHRDEHYRNELEIHLSVLKRNGVISTWHDRRIQPGTEFANEISQHLEEADVILLLVSPDFLASDYCFDLEMSRAIERHESGEAVVLPIIVRACDWHDTPFGKLLAVPKDGKPVTKYPVIDEAYLEVVEALKKIAQSKGVTPKLQPRRGGQVSKQQNDSITRLPRSSNLRVKKTYSDFEKDNYRTDAFEYIANYFEGSLSELEKRNEHIKINYRRIHSNRFTATIYNEGDEVSRCAIWLADGDNYMSGIMYSYDLTGNSYNDSLVVEDDGYVLYLKATMQHFGSPDSSEKMTMEGAAEYYWQMLIERLQ